MLEMRTEPAEASWLPTYNLSYYILLYPLYPPSDFLTVPPFYYGNHIFIITVISPPMNLPIDGPKISTAMISNSCTLKIGSCTVIIVNTQAVNIISPLPGVLLLELCKISQFIYRCDTK